MTFPEIIHEIVATKAQRVLSWLFAQEPADAESFRLARVLDIAVIPLNVQAFARMLLSELDDERRCGSEECHTFVTQAFELTAHYLATPNAFLAHFMAQENGASVVEKLAALGDYPYYGEFLFEWFQREGLKSSEAQRLDFLRQTEHAVFVYAEADRVAAYLEPFEAFYHELVNDADKFQTLVAALIADKGISVEMLADEELTTTAAIAHFVKAHLNTPAATPPAVEAEAGQHDSAVEELADEEKYKAFLADLRQAGVHLPMPAHLRHIEEPESTKVPPVVLFVGKHLRDKTIDDLFHGNKFEYNRMIMMIDHAAGHDEALLNLETIIHLQRAEHASKLLLKWANVIRMKFSESSSHAVR